MSQVTDTVNPELHATNQSPAGEKTSPKISVIWVSGYRGTTFVRLVEDFLERTEYPNLETIVVDWSVGAAGAETREAIQSCGLFDRIVNQEERACGSGNRNLAIGRSCGDLLLLLEDDVRIKRQVGKYWLQELAEELIGGGWDDFCLWDPGANIPSHLASLSKRPSVLKQLPFPSYPKDFDSITKSQRDSGGLITRRYRELNLRCRGFSIVETSLSIPSFNLAKQIDLRGLSYRALDQMVSQGVATIRRSDLDWVDFAEYQSIGGWEGCEFRLVETSGDATQPQVDIPSNRLGVFCRKIFRYLRKNAQQIQNRCGAAIYRVLGRFLNR